MTQAPVQKKGSVLILGAKSDIAMATAHRFAKAGYDLQLAARKSESLEADKSDMILRYNVQVSLHEFDVLDMAAYDTFVKELPEMPMIVISAVGYMGDQKENEQDVQKASIVMHSNYEAPALILGIFAQHFQERGSGTIIGISSVAGERGRASNYVYGSAKAGFTAFLSGLRNRLVSFGVHVITVLPGFVDTKMTKGLDLPQKLTASPEQVADKIYSATEHKKNVIYVLPIWFVIMTIIKSIPEFIFKKLSI